MKATKISALFPATFALFLLAACAPANEQEDSADEMPTGEMADEMTAGEMTAGEMMAGDEADEMHSDMAMSAEGEESAAPIGKDGTYNMLRGGVHLYLAYDAEADAFSGMVHNMSEEAISDVRVEVHLSSGTELGPTDMMSLAAGESQEVMLSAAGEMFDTWTAHAEVGSGEHDSGEHDSREHDSREHN